MSYNFFNTSSTAFGSRLTAAFLSLTKLGEDAEIRLNEILENWDLYKARIGNNYRVPKPQGLDDAVRTNELFDIFNNKHVLIKDLKYENNKLVVKVFKFNNINDRMTVLSGSTTSKSGYVFYNWASSNSRPNKSLIFSSSANNSGELLFQYRIDGNNKINLIGEVKTPLMLIPVDSSHLTNVRLGSKIANANKKYTSKDYECILVIGRDSGITGEDVSAIKVSKNGKVIFKGTGYRSRRYCIIYTKPDDIITGNYDSIYRIEYV